MKTILLDKKGKKSGDIELPSIFSEEKKDKSIVLQYVKMYLNNQRESNAQVKTRGMVSGSTRKIYRQKGTGNSRQGSIRSPLHRKGGIVFGPSNERNYKTIMSKKMRKLAIRIVLSEKAKSGNLVVGEFDLPKTKITKYAQTYLSNSKLKGKTLVVTKEPNILLQKAFKGLDDTDVFVVNELNAYELMNHVNLIFDKSALDVAEKFWNNGK